MLLKSYSISKYRVKLTLTTLALFREGPYVHWLTVEIDSKCWPNTVHFTVYLVSSTFGSVLISSNLLPVAPFLFLSLFFRFLSLDSPLLTSSACLVFLFLGSHLSFISLLFFRSTAVPPRLAPGSLLIYSLISSYFLLFFFYLFVHSIHFVSPNL